MFDYSVGRSRFDAWPARCSAPTLKDFARAVLSRHALDKARAGYICAALGNDGRRTAANVLPRRWLALDVDGIDPGVFVEWRLFLTRFRGFGWPTASSTAEAPRERVIVELSEAVDRHQGIGIGALLIQDIENNFGAAVRVDPCTLRGEQPCFLPVGDVRPFYLLGDALDVGAWLPQITPPPAPPPPASAEVELLANARMRRIIAILGEAGLLGRPLPNGRGYAMVCPWHRRHSRADAPGSSATALLFPSAENGWRGAFRCLHAHCSALRLHDLWVVLQRAQAREGARA